MIQAKHKEHYRNECDYSDNREAGVQRELVNLFPVYFHANLSDMGDWQPINTAPKSWARMLLLFGSQVTHNKDGVSSGMAGGDNEIYVGCYSPSHGRWVNPHMMPKLNSAVNDWVEIEPRFWMDLPPAPGADIPDQPSVTRPPIPVRTERPSYSHRSTFAQALFFFAAFVGSGLFFGSRRNSP